MCAVRQVHNGIYNDSGDAVKLNVLADFLVGYKLLTGYDGMFCGVSNINILIFIPENAAGAVQRGDLNVKDCGIQTRGGQK
ncbi:hypothetical protein SDC9_177615 [bioreactor metagenome]|uniref:Uncharacterized protein n=1 Tax=bioreactor metagenome TaxID=1076179 RepID=A0A645GTL3_9ZZZZ